MKDIIAFVHIEKTAGTSVIHMLRDSFSPKYVDVRPVIGDGYWFKNSDLDWYFKVMPWIQIIGGHAIVPFSNLEDNYNVKYFTIFRDPVNRYISQYRYWRSALGKNITFQNYLEKSDSWNMQTKKITEDKKSTTAIKTLQEKFIVYGLVENMELFITDLACYFQRDIWLHRRNVTNNKADPVDELREKYFQDIIDRNTEDIELYNWVKFSNEQRAINFDSAIKEQVGYTQNMLVDYMYRKSFCEPISGVKRFLNGMSYQGIYGVNRN